MIQDIEQDLDKLKGTGNIPFTMKLLQIMPGGYGEHDFLLGITNPDLRKLAKKYKDITLKEVEILLKNKYHEARMLALIIMTLKFNKNGKEIYNLYIKNFKYINNWDLVDISCHFIVGAYLYNNCTDEEITNTLNKMYQSNNPWERRVSIVSCSYLIKRDKLDLVLDFYKKTINDVFPLNHKALGWMLREVSKKDKSKVVKFIKENKIKNITFNYCTEHFPKEEKLDLKKYLVILLLLVLFPLSVSASTGSISKDNIKEINDILYGYHGSDNHCHKVTKKNNKYYAGELADQKICDEIIKEAYKKAEVTLSSCVDGDTAKFMIDGKEYTTRFLAIDTEESVSSTKLNTYMGKKASNYTCKKLKNANKIEIEYDPGSDKLDKYNRVLGWIFTDDVLLQEDLVENGYAKVAYLYGKYKYTSILQEKEIIAKDDNLGIWNENNIIAKIYNFFQKLKKTF